MSRKRKVRVAMSIGFLPGIGRARHLALGGAPDLRIL
jgi:hypothetical protein